MTVALLKDFRRVVGLTVRPEEPSVLSARTSPWSVSVGCSTTAGVCVVGNWSSIRGDLFGGAESGLLDEHLLAVSTAWMQRNFSAAFPYLSQHKENKIRYLVPKSSTTPATVKT